MTLLVLWRCLCCGAACAVTLVVCREAIDEAQNLSHASVCNHISNIEPFELTTTSVSGNAASVNGTAASVNGNAASVSGTALNQQQSRADPESPLDEVSALEQMEMDRLNKEVCDAAAEEVAALKRAIEYRKLAKNQRNTWHGVSERTPAEQLLDRIDNAMYDVSSPSPYQSVSNGNSPSVPERSPSLPAERSPRARHQEEV